MQDRRGEDKISSWGCGDSAGVRPTLAATTCAGRGLGSAGATRVRKATA